MILNLLFSTEILVFTESVVIRYFSKLLAICQMSNKDSGRVVVNSIPVAAKE